MFSADLRYMIMKYIEEASPQFFAETNCFLGDSIVSYNKNKLQERGRRETNQGKRRQGRNISNILKAKMLFLKKLSFQSRCGFIILL